MSKSAQAFLAYMKQFLGLPYIWGGDNPKKGLDCSGFAQLALAYLGLDPKGDQTADGLMKYFMSRGTVIPLEEATLGCLIFYGKKRGSILSSRATHIGVLLNPFEMIEAGGGGPTTRTAAIAKLQKASVRIAHPLRRKDVICVIAPDGLFARLEA